MGVASSECGFGRLVRKQREGYWKNCRPSRKRQCISEGDIRFGQSQPGSLREFKRMPGEKGRRQFEENKARFK